MKLYKVFRADRRTLHDRPSWVLRRWQPVIKGELRACANGYHLCRFRDLPRWLAVEERVYEAEAQEVVEVEDKVVARRARTTRYLGSLSHANMVRWAADCAARALHRFPLSDRPVARNAIAAARAWARHPCERHRTAAATAADAAANTVYAAAAADAAEREWQGRRLLYYLRD